MNEKGIVINTTKERTPSVIKVEFVDNDGNDLGTVEMKNGKFKAPKGATAFRFLP